MEDEVLEKLAELEHNKWMRWARHMLSEESITTQRVQRWAKLFVHYSELSEGEKEKDRVLAREVLRIVNDDKYLRLLDEDPYENDKKSNLLDNDDIIENPKVTRSKKS